MESILNKLNGMAKASGSERKVPMTDAQIKQLSDRLYKENRMSVYPNRFDIKKPYRVQIRKGSDWTTHGYFTNIDVASAVGSLVSVATFGAKGLVGDYDQAKAEAHPEFKAWIADDRNQEVLRAVGMV